MQTEVSKEEARKIKPSLITRVEDGYRTGLRATKKEYLKAVDKSYKIIKTEKSILDQIDTYDVYCDYDNEKFIMRALIEVFR